MLFTTIINAIDPKTGKLCVWTGPDIEAISWSFAQDYCDNNLLGYCKVNGVLKFTIDEEGKKTEYLIEN